MNLYTTDSRQNHGFTIVEMLVIIGVIGTLIGLMAFGWANWKQTVAKTEVKSDIGLVATAMEDAKNFGAGYPLALPSTYQPSENVVVSYVSGTATTYCIEASSLANPTIKYYTDETRKGNAQLGACAVPVGPGRTWTARTAAQANSWRSVTYGNGLFVAVSSDGTNRVMTSPDGVTWTARVAAEANYWQAVTYGNNLFVAVSSDGTNRAMTSPNGITWTARSTPVGDSSNSDSWSAVTYGNGTYIAVASGLNGFNQMASSDGFTWARRNFGTSVAYQSIIYAEGKFVAMGRATVSPRVARSSDGVSWSVGGATHSYAVESVTYGSGTFVAVAPADTQRITTSPDGISWAPLASPELNAWQSVTFGNGLFVAVSSDGTNRVMTSP